MAKSENILSDLVAAASVGDIEAQRILSQFGLWESPEDANEEDGFFQPLGLEGFWTKED